MYGLGAKAPFSENYKSTQPISPYATSKSAGEMLCHTYSHLYNIRCICLRLITAYGPRQRPDLAIHKFTRLIHRGKPIPLFVDGSSCCDYTYVDDIIDGIFATLKYDGSDYYEVFNLGESQTIQLMLSDQEPIKMNSEIRGISPVRVKDVPDDLKSVSSPLVEHGKTVDWSDMPLYTDFFLLTVPAMLHHNNTRKDVRHGGIDYGTTRSCVALSNMLCCQEKPMSLWLLFSLRVAGSDTGQLQQRRWTDIPVWVSSMPT